MHLVQLYNRLKRGKESLIFSIHRIDVAMNVYALNSAGMWVLAFQNLTRALPSPHLHSSVFHDRLPRCF